MKKFLFIQRNDPAQLPEQPPSPQQLQEIQAAFDGWMQKFKAHVTDIGGRLEPTGRTLIQSRVIDGPFPEAKEVVGGFMIITARDYEDALNLAKAFPAGMCPGSSIEIREISPNF